MSQQGNKDGEKDTNLPRMAARIISIKQSFLRILHQIVDYFGSTGGQQVAGAHSLGLGIIGLVVVLVQYAHQGAGDMSVRPKTNQR